MDMRHSYPPNIIHFASKGWQGSVSPCHSYEILSYQPLDTFLRAILDERFVKPVNIEIDSQFQS